MQVAAAAVTPALSLRYANIRYYGITLARSATMLTPCRYCRHAIATPFIMHCYAIAGYMATYDSHVTPYRYATVGFILLLIDTPHTMLRRLIPATLATITYYA